MMKLSKPPKRVRLVAVVGIGLLIVLWWTRHVESRRSQTSSSDSVGSPAYAAKASGAPVAPPEAMRRDATPRGGGSPPSAAFVASGASLLREFRDAADLRVFVEKAKRSPERGGIYYASLALVDCMAMRASQLGPQALARRRSVISSNPTESTPQQLAALDWLEARCGGFSSDELRPRELELLETAGKGRDRLYDLRSRAMSLASSNQHDTQHRFALVEDLLKSGDPVLIEQAVWMAGRSNASQGSAAAYLDNEAHAGLGAEHFALALRLMSCRLTDSCGMKDLQIHHDCVVEARCASSIAKGVQLDAGSTKDHQRISRVADRLLDVVRAADPAPLMPPR